MTDKTESFWSRLWKALGAIALLILGSLLIPMIIGEYSRIEALRASKLNKSLEVVKRESEFSAKLNVMKTSMQIFNQLNTRNQLSPAEVKAARERFQKEYSDRYLALDEAAWWWYWPAKREAEVFEHLTPAEMQTMRELVQAYDLNIQESVGAIYPLFSYLSSARYTTKVEGQQEYQRLEDQMNDKLKVLFRKREVIVDTMSKLLTSSTHDPKRGCLARVLML